MSAGQDTGLFPLTLDLASTIPTASESPVYKCHIPTSGPVPGKCPSQGTPALPKHYPARCPATHQGTGSGLGALLLPSAHNAGPQLGRDIGNVGRAGDSGRVQWGQVWSRHDRPARHLQV